MTPAAGRPPLPPVSPKIASPPPADTSPAGTVSPRRKRIKWSFLTSLPAVLALMLVGQVVGHMMHEFPLHRALVAVTRGDRAGAGEILANLFSQMQARDWLFGGFLLATAGFVWVEREAAKRFFRALHTGI